MKIVIKWVVCVLALLLAKYIFPDQVEGTYPVLMAAGTVLWLINLCLKPILKLLSLPITILTLGLFSLVLNGFMVWLASAIVPSINIESFWVCIVIALLISIMDVIFLKIFRPQND
jgi:putative membrane protein